MLPLALASAVLSIVLIGCGGGSGSGTGPAKTRPETQPTAVPTVTPTSTPVRTALPELSFTFENGQRARFFGGTISSSGVVNAQITVTGAQSAPLQVPPGTYPVVGTLNPTTGNFALNQGANSAYKFSVAGKLPTSSADGTFTFTGNNGATENGNIPRSTVVIPTPTPTTRPVPLPTATAMPTATPTTSPNSGRLAFSGAANVSNLSSGSNMDTASLNFNFNDSGNTERNFGKITTFPQFNNGQTLESYILSSKNGISADRSLSISFRSTDPANAPAPSAIRPFFAGQRLSFPADSDGFEGIFRQFGFNGAAQSIWELVSFDATINSVSADNKNIAFTLSNARFRPGNPDIKPSPNGVGTFTLAGNISGSNLTQGDPNEGDM